MGPRDGNRNKANVRGPLSVVCCTTMESRNSNLEIRKSKLESGNSKLEIRNSKYENSGMWQVGREKQRHAGGVEWQFKHVGKRSRLAGAMGKFGLKSGGIGY